MKRIARCLALAGLTLAGCMSAPDAPRTEGLTSLADAAQEGERAFGVPADLSLAVAYAETRWTLPDADAEDAVDDEGHAPAAVGIGGLRAWLPGDPVAKAEAALGVSRERIAREPALGILATAAVLADLGHARFGDELPSDVGAWGEVLADYAGMDDAESRASYSEDVFAWIEQGVRTETEAGELVTIEPRTVVRPETVAPRLGYSGAEYSGARWVAASSSNYSIGRSGERVRYVVIHTMQGSYSGSISWFRNPAASASAHYMIRSSDGQITQMVSERNNAWHAGNSTYNRRSIGIEHEGYIAAPRRWYTDAMYRSSAALVRHLCAKYSIPIDRRHIIGHDEVPDPYHAGEFGGAGHHTDPGSGWDWSRFMALVRGEPPRPAYAATFVRKSSPAEMTSGARATVWLEFRNGGTATWSIDRTRVGTAMPRDHASRFFVAGNWINDHRASGADHSDYGPGDTGRFTFEIQAPEVTTDTTITETFGLVQEGVTWFGPENVRMQVVVHPRAAAPAPTPTPTPSPTVVQVHATPITTRLPPSSAVAATHAMSGEMSGGCSVTGPASAGSGGALGLLCLAGVAVLARRARGRR